MENVTRELVSVCVIWVMVGRIVLSLCVEDWINRRRIVGSVLLLLMVIKIRKKIVVLMGFRVRFVMFVIMMMHVAEYWIQRMKD
jgi:hypothetical protein